MGFAQEVKDFISGYEAGEKILDNRDRRRERRAKMERERTPTDADLEGIETGLGQRSSVPTTSSGSPGGWEGVQWKEASPEQRALLETISGPESGGRYNALYGHNKSFNDYSDHPRVYATITSGPNKGKKTSAAGKYQFLADTWDEAREALDLPDFSPESQDKAALWLASRDYRNYTNGRDLGTDLKSGNPRMIAQIGRSLRGTWTSLPGGIEQGINEDAFVTAFNKHLSAAPTQVAQAGGAREAMREQGIPDDSPIGNAAAQLKEDEEEPQERYSEPAGIEPQDTAFLQGVQEVYGGPPQVPDPQEEAVPAMFARNGGAIPMPSYAEGGAVDKYNPSRSYTQVTPQEGGGGGGGQSWTPRRVGEALPGATYNTSVAASGPTKSQQAFRTAQKKLAQQEAARLRAAQQPQTTALGWAARAGAAPTVKGIDNLNKYSDEQVKSFVMGEYAPFMSGRNGGPNQALGQDVRLNDAQRDQMLSYARWRLGQTGYDRAVQAGSGIEVSPMSVYDTASSDPMARRRHAANATRALRQRYGFAEGGAVPEPDEDDEDVSAAGVLGRGLRKIAGDAVDAVRPGGSVSRAISGGVKNVAGFVKKLSDGSFSFSDEYLKSDEKPFSQPDRPVTPTPRKDVDPSKMQERFRAVPEENDEPVKEKPKREDKSKSSLQRDKDYVSGADMAAEAASRGVDKIRNALSDVLQADDYWVPVSDFSETDTPEGRSPVQGPPVAPEKSRDVQGPPMPPEALQSRMPAIDPSRTHERFIDPESIDPRSRSPHVVYGGESPESRGKPNPVITPEEQEFRQPARPITPTPRRQDIPLPPEPAVRPGPAGRASDEYSRPPIPLPDSAPAPTARPEQAEQPYQVAMAMPGDERPSAIPAPEAQGAPAPRGAPAPSPQAMEPGTSSGVTATGGRDAGAAENNYKSVRATPRLRQDVSNSLRGGASFLRRFFGLRGNGAVPTAEGGAAVADGQRRFAMGEGATTQEEIQAIDDRVDPNRELSEGDRQMQRLAKMTQWYLSQGRPDDAAAAAAGLMQYGATRFSRMGSLASTAYRKYQETGEPQHLRNTIDFLERAYAMIPDGAGLDVTLNRETGSLQATRIDPDGEEETYDVTPQQLGELIRTVTDRSAYWKQVFRLADPAGARAKDSAAASLSRERLQQERLDARQRETQNRQDARSKATQDRQDARQRERLAAQGTKAKTTKQPVPLKELAPLRTEANKARRALGEFEDAEGDAYQAAKQKYDEAVSRIYDKIPEGHDPYKILEDMGFDTEGWDYVEQRQRPSNVPAEAVWDDTAGGWVWTDANGKKKRAVPPK